MPKADLRQALRESAKPAPLRVEAVGAVAAKEKVFNPHYRPGRAAKVNVTGYFPPGVKKQLRLMSAEQDKTIQQLLAEALNDVFAKYGKPEIAPVEDKYSRAAQG
jgi:hypothetical protein